MNTSFVSPASMTSTSLVPQLDQRFGGLEVPTQHMWMKEMTIGYWLLKNSSALKRLDKNKKLPLSQHPRPRLVAGFIDRPVTCGLC